MRLDEIEKKIQKNIKNHLTHKDLLNLCNHLNIQITGRKTYLQDRLLEYMKTISYNNLLSLSNQIDEYIKVSVTAKARQPFLSKLEIPLSHFQSEKLSESSLRNAPINLELEVPVSLRCNLTVPTNVPNANLMTTVPTQPSSGLSDQYPHTIQLPNSLPTSVAVAKSPFYCCSVCLHPLTLLVPQHMPNTPLKNRITSRASFSFNVTENVKQILARNAVTPPISSANRTTTSVSRPTDYRWQIVLRFVGVDPLKTAPSPNEPGTEIMPQYLTVTVNGTVQPLWELLPSNCLTKEGKRHPKPVHISDKVQTATLAIGNFSASAQGYGQSVVVTWYQVPGVFLYYYMGVYMERKLSVGEMLNLFTPSESTLSSSHIVLRNGHGNQRPIEDTLKFISSKLGTGSRSTKRDEDDEDDDLVISNVLPISLQCPVGKSRIQVPIRSRSCQHLQCFDAHLFLSMNERRSVWKCPVCDCSATPEDLFCDKFFLKILNHYSGDDGVADVNVNADFTFDAIKYKERGGAGGAPNDSKRSSSHIVDGGLVAKGTTANGQRNGIIPPGLTDSSATSLGTTISQAENFINLDSSDDDDDGNDVSCQATATSATTESTKTSVAVDFRASVTNVISSNAPVQIQISNNDPSTGSIERRIHASSSSNVSTTASVTMTTLSSDPTDFTTATVSQTSTASANNILRPPTMVGFHRVGSAGASENRSGGSSLSHHANSSSNGSGSVPMYAIPKQSMPPPSSIVSCGPPPLSQGINISSVSSPMGTNSTSVLGNNNNNNNNNNSFLINSILPRQLNSIGSSASPTSSVSNQSSPPHFPLSSSTPNRFSIPISEINKFPNNNNNRHGQPKQPISSLNSSISTPVVASNSSKTSSTSLFANTTTTISSSSLFSNSSPSLGSKPTGTGKAKNVSVRSSSSSELFNSNKSIIDNIQKNQNKTFNLFSPTTNTTAMASTTSVTTPTTSVVGAPIFGGKSKQNLYSKTSLSLPTTSLSSPMIQTQSKVSLASQLSLSSITLATVSNATIPSTNDNSPSICSTTTFASTMPSELVTGQKTMKSPLRNSDGLFSKPQSKKSKLSNTEQSGNQGDQEDDFVVDDIVRCFPVLSKSFSSSITMTTTTTSTAMTAAAIATDSTKTNRSSSSMTRSPEPIACPASIVPNSDFVPVRKDRLTKIDDVINCLPSMLNRNSASKSNDISNRPRAVRTKGPPPANGSTSNSTASSTTPVTNNSNISIAPLTIDLTEDDEDDNINNSNNAKENLSTDAASPSQQQASQGSSTGPVKWVPISKPILGGSIKPNLSSSISSNQNVPNRFSYTDRFQNRQNRFGAPGTGAPGQSATSGNIESQIGYFRPHQMRNSCLSAPLTTVQSSSSSMSFSNVNSCSKSKQNQDQQHSIDLTGDDSDTASAPKKRLKTNDNNNGLSSFRDRNRNRDRYRDYREEGQVDDTDSCSSGDFKKPSNRRGGAGKRIKFH